jgi:hypothetical protein
MVLMLTRNSVITFIRSVLQITTEVHPSALISYTLYAVYLYGCIDGTLCISLELLSSVHRTVRSVSDVSAVIRFRGMEGVCVSNSLGPYYACWK